MHAGYVDALVAGQIPPGDHPAADVLAVDALHLQLHQPVVHQDVAAGGQLVMEVFIGDGYHGVIPLHLAGGEGELAALGQGDALALKGADADLRALGVQDGGNGPPQAVPHMLEAVEQGQVGLVAAVGEVEPGGVHAG